MPLAFFTGLPEPLYLASSQTIVLTGGVYWVAVRFVEAATGRELGIQTVGSVVVSDT